MTARLSNAMHVAAKAAADAAADGAKNAAFRNSIQTALGANPVVKLRDGATTVVTKALVGNLPIDAAVNAFKISATTWDNTTTSADATIDNVDWTLRIEKAGDSSVYLESDLGTTVGNKPFKLSANIENAKGVTVSDLFFNCPALDSQVGGGGGGGGAKLDSATNVSNNMALAIDAPMLGVPSFWWNTPGNTGSNIQGFIPTGNRLPAWALNAMYPEFRDNEYWTCIVPWWVMGEAAGHSETNFMVEIGVMRFQHKFRSNNTWVDTLTPSYNHFRANKSHLIAIPGAVEERTNASGHREVYVPPGTDYIIHGTGGKISFNPADLNGMYWAFAARIVKKNASLSWVPANVRVVIQAGMDWYTSINDDGNSMSPEGLIPGGFSSRLRFLTENWQAFSCAPLSTCPNQSWIDNPTIDGRTGPSYQTLQDFTNNPPNFI